VQYNPDDLAPWIATLRRRIQRGDLMGLPPVHLDEQSRIDATLIAQIMLAELDALEDLSPEEREHVDAVVRHRSLLWDQLWLRQHIG
jgi:hypothetical protein